MQLSLDPTYTSNILNDIATCVQIQSAFQMQHPRYQPLDLPEAVINRYFQLPQNLQRRYQCQKLRDYLYDIYFSHEQDLATSATEIDQTEAPLQNDSIRGINRTFYEQIQDANQGKGYFDPGWQIITASQTHRMAQKQGLKVQIKPDYHLSVSDRAAQIGEVVAIRLPKHRLEGGFYVAVGNAGLVPEQASSLEIYFNVNATGALALMRYFTQALNNRYIAFTLKLLYDPTEYGRYDAATLTIERDRYLDILPLLKTIHPKIQSELSPDIPLFTKPLAPGLGLAEVPEAEPTDFGLHRCQLVAQGLLAAWESGNDTPERRLNAIHQQFAQNQIDLQFPYLNPGSSDIYLPLD
jgi:hypothetical protein